MLSITSCSTHILTWPVAPDEQQIVDITDLFQTGHERFRAMLDQESGLEEVWLTRREEVVLILIDIEWDDGEKEQAQQSGIILNDGKLILTAGHGFFIDDGTITEVRVRTTSNLEAIVKVTALTYEKKKSSVVDWALLRPIHPLRHRQAEVLVPVETRDVVLVLGYPGGLGVNDKGVVLRIQESMWGDKYPLGMVCDRERFDKQVLFPIAGAIPIRGISGSPIFNDRGELIGLFSSLGRRRNLVGWQYIFWMSEIPWGEIAKFEQESRG